ncbi:MAG TPA: hypothetical protein VGQ76_21335 [Thermoanaerobaculia bacterium]|jgi:hypothetical protein|nr:hypothetical protein [Thermoanaerobaculia bacterium]
MSLAIFLIVFVAFAARLVMAAIAIGRWFVAVALVTLGVGIYVALVFLGLSLELPLFALYSMMDWGVLLLVGAVMAALGFYLPILLTYSENRLHRWRYAAFLAAVILTSFVVDLWRVTARIPQPNWFLAPTLWFAAGLGGYVVFHQRFFEDD